MGKSYSEAYKKAGVDITAGYKAVELMRKYTEATKVPGADTEIGGFGGLFSLPLGYKEPVLVSGTDGVGTKLKIAFILKRFDTVGIDCVAMCVNDVICCGAKPLFFLDYIACGKNEPEKIASIVKGVSEGCVSAGAALIGGETAEMPGFYPEDEFDLAGFSVGIVEKSAIIKRESMKSGDVLIALPSTGVHSNGFSLVRKIFSIDDTEKILEEGTMPLKELDGKSLLETLLMPTAIYVKPIRELLDSGIHVRGISHITGGGFYENIPRSIPDGLSALIRKGEVRTPPIFGLIQEKGKISTHDMFNTFNMGVGMSIVVPEDEEHNARSILLEAGVAAYHLGEIVEDSEKIRLI